MWLTDVSIRRPVFITMVVLALVVLGLYSRSMMPAELTPKVDFPFISIVTIYPGAGPQEIETLVSQPIEEAVGSTSGIKNVTSTSQDGVSAVFLEFEMGTDVNTAAADVRDKLSAARGKLPRDVEEPIITKADITASPLITLALKGPMSGRDLRILADRFVKDRLSKVAGVASVSVAGGQVREVSVSVDRDRLRAYDISISKVAVALQAENLNLPSGSVKEGVGGASTRDYAVRTVGEFKNAEEIENIKIALDGPSGGTVRLGDIAVVKDTVVEPSTFTRLNGVDTVILAIQKQSDANTVNVADGLRKEIRALNGEGKGARSLLPPGTKLITTTDTSVFVRDALSDVNKSLMEGIILVVIIVFLFLHSVRATFIVALAIPTSLFATYLPMNAFGFSLNMMTLLALALCVGILVDDSIVVLENIERHVRKGEPPRQAALTGRSEIGLAAVAITLVDVVVFVPVAFMGGIVGEFFRSFGITVATATLFSLFMSFTLTPMLASRWLKSKEVEDSEAASGKATLSSRLFAGFDRFYARLDTVYRGALAWALQNRALVLVIGVVTLLGLFGMVQQIPSSFKVLVCVLAVALPLAASTVKPRSTAALLWLLPLLFLVLSGFLKLALPAITPVMAAIGIRGAAPMVLASISLAAVFCIAAVVVGLGFTRGSTGRGVALIYATVMVLLVTLVRFPLGGDFLPVVDRGEINVTVELPAGSGLDATDRVTRQVERILATVDGMEYYQSTVGSTSTGSMLGGGSQGSQYGIISVKLKDRGPERPLPIDDVTAELNESTALVSGAEIRVQNAGREGAGGSPIEMEITGANMQEIVRVAGDIEQRMRSVTDARDVQNSWQLGKPELQVTVDRQRSADAGMSVYEIASALRTSIEGSTDAKLRDQGDEYDIRVRLSKIDRSSLADVSNIMVGQKEGNAIYLKDVAEVKLAAAPNSILRKNRQRLVTVGASLAPGTSLNNVQSEVNKAIAGVDAGSTMVSVGGTSQFSNESNVHMLKAMLLAIVLVYMLMGALFESFFTPFVIMFSLPQAMVGALLALMVTGRPLSIISMIGMIMLVGLVTKNAILLVDYTNTLRSRGIKRDNAILEAGPTRLRPILMTTFAMIGGMLPTAIALSKGSEQRSPMAIAVIGGLILSTLLTLLVIPTTYSVMDDIVSSITRFIRRVLHRETADKHDDGQEMLIT